jgi:hypothetical protein
MSTREITQGRQELGINEKVLFVFNTAKWGGDPSSVTIACNKYADSAYEDVTDEVFPTNTPTVDGDAINFSQIQPQAIDDIYRITVAFTTGAQELEMFMWVDITR